MTSKENTKKQTLTNRVGTYREAGLEAQWTKRNGTPFIAVRNPAAKSKHQRQTWWLVDRTMFETMQREGILKGFDQCTLLGDFFSI